MRAWTDRYTHGLVSFYSNLCLAVEMFVFTNFRDTILCERQQECGLSLSVLLGLQEGLEYFNLYECWLLFCGEVTDGRKGDSIVFQFFFWLPVMGSSWETEWEYLCRTNWMSSNYPEMPDMVLSMARYEGKCDQTPEASQAEKSHRWKEVNCVRMRSSQGSLEITLATLCPTQNVLCPGQQP